MPGLVRAQCPQYNLRSAFENQGLLASFRRNAPNPGLVKLREIHGLPIEGIKRIEAAVRRQLNFVAAIERVLPNLLSPTASS